jgi:gluconolactonase
VFAAPELIRSEVFAELPARLRKTGANPERLAAGKGATPGGSFLEGPCFDREGNLYCVDLAFGRIFKVNKEREFSVAAEYDGEPNGLAIHKDGRIFVADHKRGILTLDPKTGEVKPFVTRYHQQGFKGLNDLIFDAKGNLYFTDQGVTDLADPSGCVYKYTTGGVLELITDCVPSPNGLVFNKSETVLYLAVTRANAVWRLPFAPDGKVVRMGLHLQLSGGRGPDGMAIGEANELVVAHPEMGAVWIFNHRGEPQYRVQSCASELVTNVCFGGPDRKSLFITDSGSGSILAAKVPVAGEVLFSHR